MHNEEYWMQKKAPIKHQQYDRIVPKQLTKQPELHLIDRDRHNENQNSVKNTNAVRISSISTQTSFENGRVIKEENMRAKTNEGANREN